MQLAAAAQWRCTLAGEAAHTQASLSSRYTLAQLEAAGRGSDWQPFRRLGFGLRGVRLTYQYMDVKRIDMLVNGVNNSVLTCVSV